MLSNPSPFVISLLVFVAVTAVVNGLAFMMRDQNPKTATRLVLLVGKRRKDGESTDILRQAAFEGDRKSFLEWITPTFFNPKKLFEQADCHIPPSTLFGIGLLLAGLGATATLLA